jgi:hypothetical protein
LLKKIHQVGEDVRNNGLPKEAKYMRGLFAPWIMRSADCLLFGIIPVTNMNSRPMIAIKTQKFSKGIKVPIDFFLEEA